jgi:hypothetical protein
LRSVRSTWVCLALIVVSGIGFAVLFNLIEITRWTTLSAAERASYDPVQISQAGQIISQFVVGVVGALVITSEYSSGSIRTTLTAVPHRSTVLLAKTVVLAAVVFVVSELTSFASFFVGRAILVAHGGHTVTHVSAIADLTAKTPPSLSFGAPGVARAVFLGGLFLVLLALFALGIGFILRHTAAAISIFVGALLVFPIIVALLPASITASWARYLPSNLGQSMSLVATNTINSLRGTAVAPVPSALIFTGYVVVILVAGLITLRSRDA